MPSPECRYSLNVGPTASTGCGPINPCWYTAGTLLVYGHGTGTASVAAGRITGIAPDASIVAVLNSDSATTYTRMLLDIIKHAYAPTSPQVRTAIISISTAPPKNPNAPALDALIGRMIAGVNELGEADANGRRFLFVAMAGNAYPGDPRHQCGGDNAVMLYPSILGASFDGFITVGVLDRQNRYWTGSCSGAGVELLAPAEEVFVASISSNDAYRYGPLLARSGCSSSTRAERRPSSRRCSRRRPRASTAFRFP